MPAPAHLETLLMQYKTIKEDEQRFRASRDGEALENREVRLKETEVALEKEREKVKESEERVYHVFNLAVSFAWNLIVMVAGI